MEAKDFGRRVGIGLRVAGRIAKERAQAQEQAGGSEVVASVQSVRDSIQGMRTDAAAGVAEQVRVARQKAPGVARAAGRGVGGFLRPFGRVGGILWLEVTGFFFGLIALYFGFDIWKVRTSLMVGPEHIHSLLSAGAALLFAYLCVSAYWRAGRK